MSDFDDLLKNSVLGVGKAYETAESDLFTGAAEASAAVAKITNGIAKLGWTKVSESVEGTGYNLCIGTEKAVYEIAYFFVPSEGYPIRVGSSQTSVKFGSVEKLLRNREELRDYFLSLVSTPGSRLVLRVAFLMRQATASQESGKDES